MFIKNAVAGAEIALVAFAANAAIIQMPTSKESELDAAINQLFMQRGTAIGSGILSSLDAIALWDSDGPAPNSNSPQRLRQFRHLHLFPRAPIFLPSSYS